MGIFDINGSALVQGSRWAGAKMCFIGDSITEGVRTSATYMQYISEALGCTFTNLGINASSVAKITTTDTNPMCERLTDIPEDSDIIFLFGGTNDFYYGVQIGEWYATETTTERTYSEDTTTFRGALIAICSYLKTNFPSKQVVLMTPLHRGTVLGQNTDMQKKAARDWFEAYVDAVREAAELFSVNLIDLYRDSGLFPNDEANAALYFSPETFKDTLHPNAEGHRRIAEVILAQLEGIPRTG